MPAIFELIQNNYSGYVSSLPVMGASDKCDKSKLADIIADAENISPELSSGDFTACNNFDVSERLGEIKVPLLVLTAEEDRLSLLNMENLFMSVYQVLYLQQYPVRGISPRGETG
jgi:hypothetical protein